MKSYNLVGQRFSALLVQGRLPERAQTGGIMWQCRCDCGAVVAKVTSDLIRKKAKRCGKRCGLTHTGQTIGDQIRESKLYQDGRTFTPSQMAHRLKNRLTPNAIRSELAAMVQRGEAEQIEKPRVANRNKDACFFRRALSKNIGVLHLVANPVQGTQRERSPWAR